MKTRLRIRCKACGYWNRIEVNKIFIEQETRQPKVKAIIPIYELLEIQIFADYCHSEHSENHDIWNSASLSAFDIIEEELLLAIFCQTFLL